MIAARRQRLHARDGAAAAVVGDRGARPAPPCWCSRSACGGARAASCGAAPRWRCCWRSSSTRRSSRRSARRCATSRSSSSTNSPSQQIGDRREATEAALKALNERLAHERDLDVRVVRAGKPQPGSGDDGTRLFAALSRAMSDIPRQRLAGVVMITDGEVHDVPAGDRKATRRGSSARRCTCCCPGQPRRGRPPPRRRPGAELRPRRQGHAADRPGRGSAGADDRRAGRGERQARADLAQGRRRAAPADGAGRPRRRRADPDRSRRPERARTRRRAGAARADPRQQPRRRRRQRRARPAAGAAGVGRAACRRAGVAQHPQIRPVGRSGAFHDPAAAGKAGRHADQRIVADRLSDPRTVRRQARRFRPDHLRPLQPARHHPAGLYRECRALCAQWRRVSRGRRAQLRHADEPLPHAARRDPADRADRQCRSRRASSRN